MPAPLTLDLDQETVARVDTLAAERAMTRTDVVRIALAEFLDAQSESRGELMTWQRERIEAGLAAAERGDFASDGEVEAVFGKYRDAAGTPKSRGGEPVEPKRPKLVDPYIAYLNELFWEWNTPEDAEAFDDL